MKIHPVTPNNFLLSMTCIDLQMRLLSNRCCDQINKIKIVNLVGFC